MPSTDPVWPQITQMVLNDLIWYEVLRGQAVDVSSEIQNSKFKIEN